MLPIKIVLPIMPKYYIADTSNPYPGNTIQTVELTMLDTNEFVCTNGHCSKCGPDEHRVYKVKSPHENRLYVCPEGHSVMHHFIEEK